MSEDETRIDEDDVEAHGRSDRADEGRSDYKSDMNTEPKGDDDDDVELHGVFDNPKVDRAD